MLDKLEKITSTVNKPFGTILFLHSFMGKFQLRETMRNYYKEYNFYGINLPGHGESPITKTSDISIENFINLLKEFVESNNLEDIVLVSHSLGSGLAAILNTIFPNRIKLNVFEAPACGVMQRNYDVIEKLIPSSIDDTKFILEKMYFDLSKTFGSTLNKVVKSSYEMSSKTFGEYKKIFTRQKVEEMGELFDNAYKQITAPSLVIMGQSDGILPTGLLSDHFKSMNNSKISQEIIPRSSHVVYFEQQKKFLVAMDRFLFENGLQTTK